MAFERINFRYSPNDTGEWVPGRWASDRERTIFKLGGSPRNCETDSFHGIIPPSVPVSTEAMSTPAEVDEDYTRRTASGGAPSPQADTAP